MLNKMHRQSGEVSIFIVIFSALLIVVVTVSFINIMLQDQQQASESDLSQSAYDSALAGVEDAKRALIRYQTICANDSTGCLATEPTINSATCNAAVKSLTDINVNASNSEVKVQTGSSQNAFDQAYTCTKVSLNTSDYLGVLQAGTSVFVPLKATESFNTIQIQWFNSLDAGTNNNVSLYANTSDLWLLPQNAWVSSNSPAVMRTELIQYASSGSFTLGDLNTNGIASSNVSTVFLYPTSNASDTTYNMTTYDKGLAQSNKPLGIRCSATVSSGSGGYACSARLSLPNPVNGDSNSRTAYLWLTALYNKSNYRISLYNGSTPVQFKGVQPEIDSTGRANDLFRRVKSRVVMYDASYTAPQSAVYVTYNICKDFSITDNPNDYQSSGCAP